MRFALYLLAAIGTDDPDGGVVHAWALDGNLTRVECEARRIELAPAYALMGPAATLACEEDHAPEAWN